MCLELTGAAIYLLGLAGLWVNLDACYCASAFIRVYAAWSFPVAGWNPPAPWWIPTWGLLSLVGLILGIGGIGARFHPRSRERAREEPPNAPA